MQLEQALLSDPSHIPAILLLRSLYQLDPTLIRTPVDVHPYNALLARAHAAYTHVRCRTVAENWFAQAEDTVVPLLNKSKSDAAAGAASASAAGAGGAAAGADGAAEAEGAGGAGIGGSSVTGTGGEVSAAASRPRRAARRLLSGKSDWQGFGRAHVEARVPDLLFLRALYLDVVCENPDAAFGLYRTAADMNFPPAMFYLGVLCESGSATRCVVAWGPWDSSQAL